MEITAPISLIQRVKYVNICEMLRPRASTYLALSYCLLSALLTPDMEQGLTGKFCWGSLGEDSSRVNAEPWIDHREKIILGVRSRIYLIYVYVSLFVIGRRHMYVFALLIFMEYLLSIRHYYTIQSKVKRSQKCVSKWHGKRILLGSKKKE